MTFRPQARGTLPSTGQRPCTYCPNPGADCFVRVQDDGRHVYAHRDAIRLHTERFSQAVGELGSDSPAVRLGGVHALAGHADDAPDDAPDNSLRQTCIDVLCAYLQLPFTPDPGSDPAH
ncbi:hypothetical protein [Streptomyces sp. NPDC026092]|uniref:hypothetical protein n=1 Tax=Streptomyces sp. NPDC026092 TaxID=3154797 RepID=UPI0033FDE4E2